MKVCNVGRYAFYQVLERVFFAQKVRPNIAELGVLRGENALQMYNTLSPQNLVLIDSWSVSANDAYNPFDELPPWVEPVETYEYYYGGPMREQATFDRLYDECRARFEGLPNVHFIRADTIGALDRIQAETGIEKFELVYVDANHQYEYVLRDLMMYRSLVADDGCIVLNDCCHSLKGTQQNLGVLEAVTSFVKRTDFIPVALTNTDFSDVILVRKNTLVESIIDYVFTHSDIAYVDVPHQLLPAAKVVYGEQRTNISFV